MDNLQYEISKLKEERGRDIDEIQKLRDLAQYRDRENQEQTSRMRAVDYDLAKAAEKNQDL